VILVGAMTGSFMSSSEIWQRKCTETTGSESSAAVTCRSGGSSGTSLVARDMGRTILSC
jgi:hypothetical protein